MIRKVVANGWYADAMPWGEYAATRFDGIVETHLGDLPSAGTAVLYPVCTNVGGFKVAGQPHTGGLNNIEFANGVWSAAGPSHGVNPVIYDNNGVLHNATPANGSQGFRFVDANNRLWTGDETNADPARQIWEWTEQGNITVGFSSTALVALWNGTRRVIASGAQFGANSVNFKRDGTRCVVTWHDRATLTVTILWFEEMELAGFPLETSIQEPVPAIGKPCWLGWFEFIEPINPAPHNCMLRVKEAGLIRDGSSNVAQWVQGSSVEEIEAQAAASINPAVAYWDARNWPRWPVLPANAWIGLQAYRRADESNSEFEADIRRIVADATARYAKVAVVCQCYTSNTGNTIDLASLPPVYARVARDFPAVNMLLVFSDEGRATGLNDHPEVRQRWQDLFNGITGKPANGVPPMGNGIVDGVLVDPEAYFRSLVAGKRPQDYQTVLRDIQADLYLYGIGQQCSSNGVPRGRLYLPTAICPNAKPTNAEELVLGVKQDPKCWEAEGHAVNVVSPDATEWIWRDHRGDLEGAPAYQPIDSAPEPPVGDLPVLIHGYDRLVHRSDPNGMLVRFDVGADRPVTQIKAWLNDGEPPFVMNLPLPSPPDGRYLRAIAWKPVRNGTWTIFVEATDDQGRSGRSDGSHTVTVVE